MITKMDKVKLALSTIAGMVGYFLGGFDLLIETLVTLIALDIATGIIAAVSGMRFSSSEMRKGAYRKVGYFVLIAIAHTLDRVLQLPGMSLRSFVCTYLILTEGASCLENLSKMGVPVPKGIARYLNNMKRNQESQIESQLDIQTRQQSDQKKPSNHPAQQEQSP